MSEESRGGVFEDTTAAILDQDHEQEQDMRPNHNQYSRRYENHNYRNSVPERPVKKILKKKKKSNAGKICSFTGVILVILIIGAFLLVKFQKEIESKIFTLKSPETENRTIPPSTKKKNLDQRSPGKNNNSGENSSVLVKKKEQEKENKSAELEEEEEPIAGLEDRKDDTIETDDEPPPHRVPISVGASESKTITNSDTDNTGTKLKSEITPPPEEPVELPENPTTEHLFKAIEDGDVRMAKALINLKNTKKEYKGIDFKKYNAEGFNLLHYATNFMNIDIMRAILVSDAGIDIEAKIINEDAMTALHLVCDKASKFPDKAVAAAQLLIENGAAIDSLANDGYTPLLFAATISTHPELIQFLLEKGANPDDELPVSKQTPLHQAMEVCDERIIEILIAKGASVDSLNSYLRQPVHEAVHCGCSAGIMQLVTTGNVDINVKTPARDTDLKIEDEYAAYVYYEATPLHFAAIGNKIEAVKILGLFRAEMVIRDDNSRSAQDYAEESGFTDILLLIQYFHQKALDRRARDIIEPDYIKLLRLLKPGVIDYEKKKAHIMSLMEA